jgi:hypothetical protein
VYFDQFNSLAVNAAGQIAFSANVASGTENDVNDRGIWATDRVGGLQLIALTGDVLQVAPGDFRIISSLDFVALPGNGDGAPSGLNSAGQVSFRAAFTDGSSGAFVSNVAAVPEPTSLGLATLTLVALATRSRSGAPR